MDQIEEYDPPPNVTKEEKNARVAGYYEEFGDKTSSWELDALKPSVIDALVRERIDRYVEWDKFDANIKQETENRSTYAEIGRRLSFVRQCLVAGSLPQQIDGSADGRNHRKRQRAFAVRNKRRQQRKHR